MIKIGHHYMSSAETVATDNTTVSTLASPAKAKLHILFDLFSSRHVTRI